MSFKSDIEIAQSTSMQNIIEVSCCGIPESSVELYGN